MGSIFHDYRRKVGQRLALAMMTPACAWLAGCASPQEAVQVPNPVTPGTWSQPAPATAAPPPPGVALPAFDAAWWSRFGSPELDGLVERAQRQSLDLAAAVARVRQAQAVAHAAGAALLPELQAGLDAQREDRLRDSAALVEGARFGATLAASYEVDFWGGNRAARDAGLATLQASRFDRDTVRLALTAAVSSAWLQAVSASERLDIAQRNLASAQQVLSIVEARRRAGAAVALEVAQQRGLVAAQRRALAAVRQEDRDARATIALLLGQMEPVELQADSLRSVRTPSIGPGLPSELVARRPDIARAQARLAAADADVTAARAAMLPSVRLGAGIGTGGDRWRAVLDDPIYSVAAALVAPIFDAGRLAAGHAQAQARREELLADYRGAIVAAFDDVERALNALSGARAEAAAQADELQQARHALDLAEARYRAGAEPMLTLLDAQRTLYAAQDLAVQLHQRELQSAVALYRALGGGWSAEATELTAR